MADCNETRRLGSRVYICVGERGHDKGEHYYMQADDNLHRDFLIGIVNGLILSAMIVLLTFSVCYWVFQ